MDPKTLANLDPKLRETYERVMGSSSPPAPAASSPSSATSSTPTVDPIASAVLPSAAPAKPAEPDNNFKISNVIPSTPVIGAPFTTATPPPAPSTDTTPASSVPIPPPSPAAVAAAPPPGTIDTFAQNPIPPALPADLNTLQPNLLGTPVRDTKEVELQLSKPLQPLQPLQPLPSPASVNQQTPTPAAAGGPSTLIRVLYILAGIIFFIVYAIFWLKIFHYPLPF